MGLPTIGSYALPARDELPHAKAPWTLQPGRAALLVHDMQNYFLKAFTPDVTPISTVIQKIAQLLSSARAAAIPVFYTAQEGDQDRRDRGLQADLWGPGMSRAKEHQSICEKLVPQATDIVLTKHRYSAFQRSNLEELMRVRQRDQLIICGVYAHIGCMLSAAEAFMRDIEPFLVADATADFSKEKHDLAIAYVAGCCGVPVMTEDLLAMLKPEAKS